MSETRSGLVASLSTTGAVVREWISASAHPLASVDPLAPLSDLLPLQAMLAEAQVVGLGGSTRGAHELFAIKHRVLRVLVEQLGFRSLALEEDWTKGVQLDEYLRRGTGDPIELLADARPFWRNQETLDLLGWLRAYNLAHPTDPVRLFGVDITAVRALAYDAVAGYIHRVAPQLLDELEGHYTLLRPSGGIDEHVLWYRSQDDKAGLVDRARQAYDLVEQVDDVESTDRALALQHARAIVAFYEYYALGTLGYAERCLAGNTVWWYELTGDKIAYWGGTAHTAVGNATTISSPPWPPMVQRNAGAYLRSYFGRSYVSVGLTFDRGSAPLPVPGAPPEFAESIFADVDIDTYLLDLRGPQPSSVRRWLDAPAMTRLIGPHYDPADDAAYHMCGGSLADWFDVIVHSQETTPIRPL